MRRCGGLPSSGLRRGTRRSLVRRPPLVPHRRDWEPVWRPRSGLRGCYRGLVRCCGLCNGPMSVVGSSGRLGFANHREHDTCTDRWTVLRD